LGWKPVSTKLKISILRKTALRIGQEQNIKLHEGVYVMSSGPQYEVLEQLPYEQLPKMENFSSSFSGKIFPGRFLNWKFSIFGSCSPDNLIPIRHHPKSNSTKLSVQTLWAWAQPTKLQ
jgi:hypothetical protein